MYLLGYLPYSLNSEDREHLIMEQREKYASLKDSWLQELSSDEKSSCIIEEKHRIGKQPLKLRKTIFLIVACRKRCSKN
jgi:hypothetical protein